jgi:hypothetical protein
MPAGGIIPGAVRGAINPPAGLSRLQGAAHGAVDSIPIYRLINSFIHMVNGTTGQFGDPANNPINHPENFGQQPTQGQQPTAAAQPPIGNAIQRFGGPNFVNAYPSSFGNFAMQPGEISAGGAVAGFDSINGQPVYNPRGVIPAGSTDTSTSIPFSHLMTHETGPGPAAAAFEAWIARHTQI